MKISIETKLKALADRYQELASLLSDPEVISNQNKFRELSKEYAQIEPVVEIFQDYQKKQNELRNVEAMVQEGDAELKELAEGEVVTLKLRVNELEKQLQILLLPKDPNDNRNVFLEIRAGTGGDEASIFAGDLFRMYSRYAESQGWRMEIVSRHEGEHGGYKEIITRIVGAGVYGKLKFESGAHRVQRVPVTESQGRIHTSACTVAIMPEAEEIEEIYINPHDLKIDTYRSSGAGGQHVNKTDSAIRITHLPSGIVIECQDERSQHKNRARAMSLLKAKLLDIEKTKQEEKQAETRRNLVGSGDRSERIRTYNFPQDRMTDHRINLTLYKLDQIMEGDLEEILNTLSHEHQADRLAAIGS